MLSRYWRLQGFDGVDLLRADRSAHRYARHSHEGYALGVVELGAHSFMARGRRWTAIPGRVVVVNPEEPHDGGPATDDIRCSYRMIYIDRALMAAACYEAVGHPVAPPFFPDPVVDDSALAGLISLLHRAFESSETRLARETQLNSALVAIAARHATAVRPPDTSRRDARVAEVALDYLTQHFADDVSLSTLATVAGVDRFRLLRAFRRRMGLPPHLYQNQLRLRHARKLLLAGHPPVQVAAAAGFADQSHLTRKFKATYGVTPGRLIGRLQ